MTNTEYTETMVRSNERIYIDTATLMDVDGMRLFIENSRGFLQDAGRKIIVPKSVCSELARHLESENPVKRDLAMKAIGMISENPEIFQVECTPMTDEEIAKAFADAHLLSELTLHKSDCDQLLITNDKRLSSDAYSLNQQQSCKGHRIMVCFINRLGELHRCACVATANMAKHDKEAVVEEPLPTPTKVNADADNTRKEEVVNHAAPHQEDKSFDWPSAIAGFCAAIGTWCLYKGGKAFLAAM